MTMEPTPEQFAEWFEAAHANGKAASGFRLSEVAHLAYAAGADAELEACCDYVGEGSIWGHPHWASDLRYRRRPKPFSLKQEALRLLQGHETNDDDVWLPSEAEWNTIRRALESLPDD